MGLFFLSWGRGGLCSDCWVRFGGILCIFVIRVDAFHDEGFGFAVRNFLFHSPLCYWVTFMIFWTGSGCQHRLLLRCIQAIFVTINLSFFLSFV